MDQTNATGQQLQGQGQTNLNNASQYWNNLLTAGRTQTAQQSAPGRKRRSGPIERSHNTRRPVRIGTLRRNGSAERGTPDPDPGEHRQYHQQQPGGRKSSSSPVASGNRRNSALSRRPINQSGSLCFRNFRERRRKCCDGRSIDIRRKQSQQPGTRWSNQFDSGFRVSLRSSPWESSTGEPLPKS